VRFVVEIVIASVSFQATFQQRPCRSRERRRPGERPRRTADRAHDEQTLRNRFAQTVGRIAPASALAPSRRLVRTLLCDLPNESPPKERAQMTRLPMIFFVLLAPALVVLLALPIALSHVAAHILIDRMRRRDHRDAAPVRTAVSRTGRPTWESSTLHRVSSPS